MNAERMLNICWICRRLGLPTNTSLPVNAMNHHGGILSKFGFLRQQDLWQTAKYSTSLL